ncbi:YqcC family protein [Suttonella ornithocola]|uniref:Domain of uncharacterized function, DUF446 n=2 Tax=Suttonella ornithocola TaxID=279832 RepID=A0A380MVD9_9GAMM|nr:YqcC family protein [Suttonella ornithocola]SUO96258.1 Domain of uncharacterised function, DUF446 [Suttonella ornithocola]
MNTNPFLTDMRSALVLLEAELKMLGWWQTPSQKPSIEALNSKEPFCIDYLSFSEWLQWVYIPKMHAFMNQTGQLPKISGLLPIAEEAWKNTPKNLTRLHQIVDLLDKIIVGNHQTLLSALLSIQQ